MKEEFQDLAGLSASIIKDLDNKDLVSKHLRLHQLWATTGGSIRGMTREDFLNLHILITEEMKRRDLQHRPSSDLDRAAARLARAELMSDILAKLESAGDLIVVPGFVSVVGSFADGRVPHDLDILFRSEHEDERIQSAVMAELFKTGDPGLPPGGPEVIWREGGPLGRAIPLYDLILVKRQALERQTPIYQAEFGTRPWPRSVVLGADGPQPSISCIEPLPAGERFIAQIRDGDVMIVSRQGVETDVPDLAAVLATVANPSHCILDLFWDGERATAVDILRWWSTELVDTPLKSRKHFLDKADLGGVVINPYILGGTGDTREGLIKQFTATMMSEDSTGDYMTRDWLDTYWGDVMPWAAFQGRLGKVEVLKPLTPLKTRGGYGKLEFFRPETAWDAFAKEFV